MLKRSLEDLLVHIHQQWGKMVLLSGPRQVGKTTLAREYQKRYAHSVYFNWDNFDDQKKLLADPYFFRNLDRTPPERPLVIFDEIHKYARWKNYLKGVFDTYGKDFDFLITGSSRLDLLKRGGDSLMGRYLPLKLMPFSVGELRNRMPALSEFLTAWHQESDSLTDSLSGNKGPFEELWNLSGFPDPLNNHDIGFYTRWQTERKQAILREDVQFLSHVRELSQLGLLMNLLPDRVASPLSINALKEDLHCAFETVRDWIALLENLYYCFRIYPFSGKSARTLRKEAKLYLYDWGEVTEEGARFENMIAVHLLKAVEIWNEMGEKPCLLFYIRDKEKREVDFLVMQGKTPLFLVEVKSNDSNLSPSLLYYQEKFKVPVAFQIINMPANDKNILRKSRVNNRLQWLCSAESFLGTLP